MNRPSSFRSFSSRAKPKSASGVGDFLRLHDKLAALLPAVARLNALQKDCSDLLPNLFGPCMVLHYDAGQLVLATPNAALATKLKQQLPKLQDGLSQRGWQVNAIRLKVQLGKIAEKSRTLKDLELPGQALSAFEELRGSLDDSPTNAALRTAVENMLQRHRRGRRD
ncbi:DUF721 domain-containing protein [Oxalobacteraceae bacterium OM1]|nr:DUF721 domain-containing protein [Oxalobacteraceae bacterium OM1]